MNQDDINRKFQFLSDERFRAFNSRIASTPKKVYGVRTPLLREFGREVLKGDWRSFVDMPSLSLEQSLVKALVIADADCTGDERLALTGSYILEIEEWGTCDMLCGEWTINDEDTGRKLFAMSRKLLRTGKEFPMRVGAVMMLSKFIDGEHIDTVLGDLGKPQESTGYYWDMGCAWALSICYVKFPGKTEEVILSGKLSRPVLRMTLQKIRDSYRVKKANKDRLTECARSL